MKKKNRIMKKMNRCTIKLLVLAAVIGITFLISTMSVAASTATQRTTSKCVIVCDILN